MIVDTVVFDLDGTLADTAEDVAAALNSALRRWGMPELHLGEVRRHIGLGGTALVCTAATKAGRNLTATQISELQRDYVTTYNTQSYESTTLYPGAEATLAQLRNAGIKVALCTNKLTLPTRRVLTGLGLLSHFDAVICGDTLSCGKPDPAPVRAAVARAGGQYAILVGDTSIDVTAARRAAIPVICVDYGYYYGDLRELHPDAVVQQLPQLPRALARAGMTLESPRAC